MSLKESAFQKNKNFIGIYDDVVSIDYCKKVIEHFENVETVHRLEDEHSSSLKRDNKIYFINNWNKDDSIIMSANGIILKSFVEALSKTLEKYKKEYPVLIDGVGRYDINNDIKIQRTLPGEGYHVWHCENSNLKDSRRMILVFMYLNDCEEGGETEFLYQHERVKPKTGRMVLAPASWTHFHRGNPPLKNAKYMINGWLEYHG